MINRKLFLASLGAGAMSCVTAKPAESICKPTKYRYAINPATIRGYHCSLREQVRLAIAAGYTGIEPWLADLYAAKKAGELSDIHKMCVDGGLSVISGIGFARWAVPDAVERAKGLEELKRDMELLQSLDCKYVAAPPIGISEKGTPKVALDDLVPRYQAILRLGEQMGVTPILEFWGASANVSRLNEAVYIASMSGSEKAAVLADICHLQRGGSEFEGLRFLSKTTLPVLHINDFPDLPKRELLNDANRVWPGDGVAPWSKIRAIMRDAGLNPWLSIEIFNPSYWRTNPLDTLKTGLAKMKAVMEVV